MHFLLSACVLLSYAWLHYASELVMRLVLIQPVSSRRARWCFAATLALSMHLFILILWDLAVLTGHGVGVDTFFFGSEGIQRARAFATSTPADALAAFGTVSEVQSSVVTVASVAAAHAYRVKLFQVSLSCLVAFVLVLNPLTVIEFFFSTVFTRRGGGRRSAGAAGAVEGQSGRRVRRRRSLLGLLLLLALFWWLCRAPPLDGVGADDVRTRGFGTAPAAAARDRLSRWLQTNENSKRFLAVPPELSSRPSPPPRSSQRPRPGPGMAARMGLMQHIQSTHDHSHGHGEGGHHDDHGDHATKDKVPALVGEGPRRKAHLAAVEEPVKRDHIADALEKKMVAAAELRRKREAEAAADAEDEEQQDDDDELDEEFEDEENDAQASDREEEEAAVVTTTSTAPQTRPSKGKKGNRLKSTATTTTTTPTQHESTTASPPTQDLTSVLPGLVSVLFPSQMPSPAASAPSEAAVWRSLLQGVTARLAMTGVVLSGLLAGYAAFTTPFVYITPYLYWRGKEAKLLETQTALCKRQRHVLQLYAAKQVSLAQAQYAALHEQEQQGVANYTRGEEQDEHGGSSGAGGVASSVKSVWSSLRRAGGRAASTVAAAVHWKRADVVQLAAESEGARFLSMTLFLQADGVGHMLLEARRGRTCVGPLYALLGVLFATYSLAKTLMTGVNLLFFRRATKDSVTTAVDWLHFLFGPQNRFVDVIGGAVQTLVLVVNGWMITASIRSLLLTLLQLTMSVAGGAALSRADSFTVVLASCVGTYFIGQMVMLRQQLPDSTAAVLTPNSPPWRGGVQENAPFASPASFSSSSSFVMLCLGALQNVLLEVLGALPVHYYQRLNDWSFLFGLAGTAFVRRFVLRDPATRGINAVA